MYNHKKEKCRSVKWNVFDIFVLLAPPQPQIQPSQLADESGSLYSMNNFLMVILNKYIKHYVDDS